MLSRSKLCPNVNSNHHSPLFRYGTRLNGVVLDSLSMATFCKMRAGSYVRIITPRSATPPPSTQVDSSCNSEDISGDAVDRNANLWTTGPQDILNMIDSHERASLASNRWTVDHQDTTSVTPKIVPIRLIVSNIKLNLIGIILRAFPRRSSSGEFP